ncbi:CAP domain-containing protein [Miltoncostaea marina]|uniref:CAP domain-containing protein n=1 Tax=Miltoncostaea marina TaxID=2843215 RepID=UPI001C3CFA0B|nr:CAP domain-containing protein [Miltoncostaea marina]
MTNLCRVLITGVVGAALVPAVAVPAAAAPAPPSRAMERAVVAEMNAVRAKHSRPRVRGNPRLARAARAHSRSLQRRGVLSHDGPKGAPFWSRIVAAGFPRTRRMAENIAMVDGCGRAAARRTVRMWMNSPAHRANVLDRRLRLAGAGVACNARTGFTVVTADYTS